MPEFNPAEYHRRFVRLHRVVGAGLLILAVASAFVIGRLIEDSRWGGREPLPINENRAKQPPTNTAADSQSQPQTDAQTAPTAPPSPFATISPPGNLRALDLAIRAAVARVRPAVVRVRSAVREKVHPASGTIISPNGLILTAAHVVTQMGAVPLTPTVRVELADGREFAARPLGGNHEGDYALLKIEGLDGEMLPCVEIGEPAHTLPGSWVLTIANGPNFTGDEVFGRLPAVRLGRLLGGTVMKSWVQEGDGWRLLVSDAPVLPGDSGGALVDLDGQLLGIISGIGPDAENLPPARRAFGFTFAARIDAVMADQSRLMRGEWFGQRLADLCCSPRGIASALPGRSISWTPNIWSDEWIAESDPATRASADLETMLIAEPAILAAWRATVVVKHKQKIIGNGVVIFNADGHSLIVCGALPARTEISIGVPTSIADELAWLPASVAGTFGAEKFGILQAAITHIPAVEFSTDPLPAGACVVAVGRGAASANAILVGVGVVAADAVATPTGDLVTAHDAILPAPGNGGPLVTLDGRVIGINLRTKPRLPWQAFSVAALQAAFAERERDGH